MPFFRSVNLRGTVPILLIVHLRGEPLLDYAPTPSLFVTLGNPNISNRRFPRFSNPGDILSLLVAH